MVSQGEGKDVQLFRAVCNNTIDKIAKSESEERFLQLFRPVLGSTSKCKKVCEILKSKITEDVNGHLNDMIEEEELDKKFTRRAELLEQQKEFEGTVAWRPTGDPNKDQRSHDMQVLLQMKAAMEEYLAEKEPYVDGLLENVRNGHEEAAQLQSTICNTLNKVAEVNVSLDELEEGSLKVLKALAPITEEDKENSLLL